MVNNNGLEFATEINCDGTIDGVPELPQEVQDGISRNSSSSFWELVFILKCINHYEDKEHFKTSDDLLKAIKYGCEKIINRVYNKPHPTYPIK